MRERTDVMDEVIQEVSPPHPGNRLVFREVNDRLRELVETFATDEDSIELVCECGRANCIDRINVRHETYDLIRGAPGHFVLKLGHRGSADILVAQLDDCEVIEAPS